MNFKVINNKSVLNVVAINFASLGVDIEFIKPLLREVAKPIVELMPSGEYFCYIRDLIQYSIDGKYPGGHTYNRYETMIALPSWECDKTDIRSVLAHELHHLARWQFAGYGYTLGGAILSEGLATLYEERVSGKQPLWAKTKINKEIIQSLAAEWDSKTYNHHDWFSGGPYGKWVGYSIGYQIAKQFYKDNLNLKHSLLLKATYKDIDEYQLLHSH